jgi:hypothetical protein
VNSLFHYTKIPMMEMKVLVYSNFRKNIFWKKKEISKLHEKCKISPSKVLEQGSKNGGDIHLFSQNAKPIS